MVLASEFKNLAFTIFCRQKKWPFGVKFWCLMLLSRSYVYFNPLEIPSELYYFEPIFEELCVDFLHENVHESSPNKAIRSFGHNSTVICAISETFSYFLKTTLLDAYKRKGDNYTFFQAKMSFFSSNWPNIFGNLMFFLLWKSMDVICLMNGPLTLREHNNLLNVYIYG